MAPVVAGCLGIPTSSLRLIVPADIGGSFGIKSAVYPYIALMALASKYAGRPVRWTEDRLEHLQASSSGSDRLMTFSAAVDDDGVVSALRVDLVDNVGAYLRPPEPSTLYRCFGNITGAYRIDEVEIRARAVVTNKAPTGLNRGFGGQQLYFGLERLIDDIAAELGLDPADVRRRNLLNADQFPHATPSGGIYDSGDYHRAFELALANVDYDRLRKEQVVARDNGEWMGIGMATIVDPSATNIGYVGLATPVQDRTAKRGKSGSTEHVRISVDLQGVVSVLLGTVPQGQGHATVARDIVAKHLGLPVETGAAARRDGHEQHSLDDQLRQLLLTVRAVADQRPPRGRRPASRPPSSSRPAYCWKPTPRPSSWPTARCASSTSPPGRSNSGTPPGSCTGTRVRCPRASRPGSTRRRRSPRRSPRRPRAPTRSTPASATGSWPRWSWCGSTRRRCRITIENVSSVHDAGTILNQTLLDGQIHGALAQALGGALYEEMTYSDSGQPTAGTFMDYLCPTSAESCFPLVSDHVVTPSPLTRLGAKGSGEGSSMSLPVAIANAVADALAPEGIAINSLPLHGNVLHQLLHQTKGI